MSFIVNTFIDAFELLFPPNPALLSIVGLSLLVTLISLLLALLIGAPLGALLTLKIFPGKKQTEALVRGGMGFPPVLIGLLISLLLWPQKGPFSSFGLLHTPAALIITQSLIILPIVVGFTMTGIQQINPKLILQFQALGASPRQLLGLLLWETRLILVGATLVSCGRILSEVGASLMTGGNIPGYTEILATAIAMETFQGNLALAVALGLILLFFILTFSLIFVLIKKREKAYEYSY